MRPMYRWLLTFPCILVMSFGFACARKGVPYDDMEALVEYLLTNDEWYDEYKEPEEQLDALFAPIPLEKFPLFLTAVFQSPIANGEEVWFLWWCAIENFADRTSAKELRAMALNILEDDKAPDHLKLYICAHILGFLAEKGDDLEQVMADFERIAAPRTELWLNFQAGMSRTLEGNISSATRRSDTEKAARLRSLAERQIAKIMPDLLRSLAESRIAKIMPDLLGYGAKDETERELESLALVYATILAMYRQMIPIEFEEALIRGFGEANLGVPEELAVLKTVYRSRAIRPEKSGSVRQYAETVGNKAASGELTLADEDRRIIRMLLDNE